MKEKLKMKKADIEITLVIIPIVIALTAGFFVLTGYVVLQLSKDKMVSKSENYAKHMNTWAERVLNELEIYKAAIDREGALNEHAFSMLSSSYGPHNEYPYGLYWGNGSADFYDASGWNPGPQYIPATRNWYKEGLEHAEFQFGEPYIDVKTDRPCVSATVALNYDGVESVLAADVYFDYADELIERLTAQEISHAFFISDKTRMVIASSDAGQTGTVLNGSSKSELYREIDGLLDKKIIGLTRLSCDGIYYVNVAKIEGVDWYFVTCMREKTMMQGFYSICILIFIVGIIGCVLLIVLANRSSKSLREADARAKTDSLTGIFNRNGFFSMTASARKKLPDQCAMLIIDVDNFKTVNDNLGHPAGDEFLRSFSQMLCEYFNRSGDVCARLGGDEFAVFLGRKVTTGDISSMLNTFMGLFHAKYDAKYPEQKLSVSIGAAFVKPGDNSLTKVYDAADKALYKAKNMGKNQYVIEQ